MKDDHEEINWSEYCYKENHDDKIWWVDTSWFARGLMLFTFDKEKFYNPVSYTHLEDEKLFISLCNQIGKQNATAVSYTHLDVYKRQQQEN